MADSPQEIDGVPQLDPAAAYQRVAGGAFLLDVREPDEWAAGHSPEATHVPLGQLGEAHGDIPRDRPVVVVCRLGGRSQQAALALKQAGFDVVNAAGGMTAWLNEGLPVVAEDGSAGSVI